MTARPLVFVVGTGRCGSTALSGVLRLHPEVVSVSELFAALSPGALPPGEPTGEQFWRLLSTPRPFATRMIRQGHPMPEYTYPAGRGRFSARDGGIPAIALMTLPHLTDDPDALFDHLAAHLRPRPAAPAADHYRALFDLLAGAGGGRVVVERSGYSLRSVPALRAAFPEARFVHLHRDGPDCALSMSRHPGFRMIQLMRRTGPADADPGAEALPAALERLLADESADLRPLLERPVPVEEFGTLWSETVIEGLRHLDAVPAADRTGLAYETLLERPASELTRLAHHMGVAPDPAWIAAATAHLDGGRRGAALALPPREHAALLAACAPGTRALEHAGTGGAAGQ